MKKQEYKLLTDHFELRLCYWEPEDADFVPPVPGAAMQQRAVDAMKAMKDTYLLIGPPGGQLARIDAKDSELLMVMIQRAFSQSYRQAPMVHAVGAPGGYA